VSPRSVSDLERGINRTARKDTAQRLAGALGLAAPARAQFVAAARGKAAPEDVLAARRGPASGAFTAAATRALPRDTASFTGREGELARVLEALASEAAGDVVLGIHAIDGMAGIGKTALAVHAAHRLAGSFPDGQFFLLLHAHTPGQRPVDPADALASLLLTAGVPAAQIPPGLEARAARWRDYVAGKKVLLLLDDAAGHEQVRPLLPGTAGSLVLITSRRRLAALEDAAQISLDTLSPPEAAALLARLAARPEMCAGDAAVGEITRLCGYLPLAIGMLASQLRNHPAWTGAGLAAELAAARDRLALMHAENVSVAAAFGLSYADLTPGPRRLFRRLGLVPGPRIDAYAAAALDGTGLAIAGGSWMSCMTSICSPSPLPAATSCTTCSGSTPAPLPPPTTPPNQTRRPGGCWIITCTPPWPPAGTSPPGPAPIAARRSAAHRPTPPACPPSRKRPAGWKTSERTCTPPRTTPPAADVSLMRPPSPPR